MVKDQKTIQKEVYNKNLLNDLGAGLGAMGFNKIKNLKELAIYKAIKELKMEKGKLLLDVGSNAGELLNKCVATFGVKGYGIDISEQTINFAKRHNPYENHYIVGDAEKMSYQDNFFDYIISTDVLEHVPNPQKVLSEIRRVLKPKGKFFIYCISGRNFLTVRYLMQIFHHPHAWGDLSDHKKELLIDPKIFKNLPGLKIKKISYFDSFFMHLTDEFILRPLLNLFALRKKCRGDNDHNSIKLQKLFGKVHMSLVFRVYYWLLQIIYYICLVLDTPWRIFKTSDAILVIGEKAE